MDRKAKEFREKYKVDINMSIEDFIRQEQIKIRVDKNLSDKQKKERLKALQDVLDDMHNPNEILRKRNEDQWEK